MRERTCKSAWLLGQDTVSSSAGGVRDFDDLALLRELGCDRLNVTIGSALDLFGGSMPFEKVTEYCRWRRRRIATVRKDHQGSEEGDLTVRKDHDSEERP